MEWICLSSILGLKNPPKQGQNSNKNKKPHMGSRNFIHANKKYDNKSIYKYYVNEFMINLYIRNLLLLERDPQ